MNVCIAEAKGRLSELLSRAEAGEEIALTRHGKIAARIVPPEVVAPLPRIGALKGLLIAQAR